MGSREGLSYFKSQPTEKMCNVKSVEIVKNDTSLFSNFPYRTRDSNLDYQLFKEALNPFCLVNNWTLNLIWTYMQL